MNQAEKTKREVKFYCNANYEYFKNRVQNSIIKLITDYHFELYGQPIKITSDIRDILNKKPEWYTKRIAVYYDEDTVFAVFFKRYRIEAEVFCDEGIGCKVAHALTKGKYLNEIGSQE